MKFTKKHIIFMVIGIILAITCMVLSTVVSVEHVTHGCWSGTTVDYSGFETRTFLLFGIAEIVLLLFRNKVIRILSVPVPFIKLSTAWGSFALQNEIGAIIVDVNFELTILNSIPYVMTALSFLLIIHFLVMCFFNLKEKKALPETTE